MPRSGEESTRLASSDLRIEGRLVLRAYRDATTGNPPGIAPRWYSVEIDASGEHWETVQYHQCVQEGLTRLERAKPS